MASPFCSSSQSSSSDYKHHPASPFHLPSQSSSDSDRPLPAEEFPDGLDVNAKTYPNKGNIYIAKTTPLSVVEVYQELFQMDLLLFLKLRHEELVFGGQMVLTFLGRKNEDVYEGDMNHLWGLLAQSVQSLVHKVQ
ncbi:hypothetical protein BAE44_0019837 [Dichanthelium oligosanthes]|uniref:Uncharacterized protein n=1 Tax=Dichanthelium oligosanthes TaxID=888268 RepID=A0A1E5V1U5_9POAL|nr:hypothetical protein BAE44_0019837 [Dichanthelium oligosanthes]